jgi:hypothetical protein
MAAVQILKITRKGLNISGTETFTSRKKKGGDDYEPQCALSVPDFLEHLPAKRDDHAQKFG